MTVWLVGYVVAVVVEMATVYMMLSLLVAIWRNTGTSSPPPGDRGNLPSAYSVFNPGLQRLQGTLDGESVDRGLRTGRL